MDAITVVTTADPALDPLTVSAASVAPGHRVTVTVTARNVGRVVANGLTISLYTGQPGSGIIVATATPTVALGFNEIFVAQMPLTATGGEQPIYAEITSSGQNASSANDRTAFVLGHLPMPVMADVVQSSEYANTLAVVWSMAPDVYVSSYRILRSSTATGPFELVGEASVTTFADTLLEPGRSYCYAVQAYNANTFSPRSDAICGELPAALDGDNKVYLPLVSR